MHLPGPLAKEQDMFKRIAIASATFAAALAMSGLGASDASAAGCYEISKFENIGGGGPLSKGGNFKNKMCTEEVVKLTGAFASVKRLLFKTLEDLYCAELLLAVGVEKEKETGYYESSSCSVKNKEAKANKSDFTEVSVPAGGASALPEYSTPTPATATSGEGAFSLESTKVTCKSDADTFGAGKLTGTFKIAFKECKSLGEECKGLAQGGGIVEATGEWHLVSQKANRKSYDIWFLLASEDGSSALHIECALPVGSLILIWGSLLGSIEPSPGTSERTLKINIETEGSGSGLKQKISEFGNNEGETVKAALKGTVDGGTVREGFESSKENLMFTEKATKILET
jgi:hypothetical protein